jgi:carboxymethylenebutenolidase
MIISSEYVDLPIAGARAMRTFVVQPKVPGKYPGILFYSDIFQLTGTMLRSCVRLAGYGFVVAAPEIYHRSEPAGLVIPFDDEGRNRGLDDAAKTPVTDFDEDRDVALAYLSTHPNVADGQIGVAGFCIGGHLAFRGALHSLVKGTVCFYGTGIHNGKLGADADAGSLQLSSIIKGELLLVWGERDPHIPLEGRQRIAKALNEAGVQFSERTYDAEHAFMRDEGPRYDPEATDLAFGEMVKFYQRLFNEAV